MDRFFISGVQSDSSSEEEEEKALNQDKVKRRRMKNMAEGLESDSDDDRRKMTQKEKRINRIKEICRSIRSSIKKTDYVNINQKAQLLLKELGKARLDGMPEFVLKTMLLMKKVLDDTPVENKKDLNRQNFKAYNAFKQKFKKEFKEYEEEFMKLDEGEDDIDELLNSDDDDESDSEDEDTSPLNSPDPMIRRTFWLKKNKDKPAKIKDEKEKEEKQEKKEAKSDDGDGDGDDDGDDGDDESSPPQKQEQRQQNPVKTIIKILSTLHSKGFKSEPAITSIARILNTSDRKLEVMLVFFQVKMHHFRANGNVLLQRGQWLELYEDFSTLFEYYQKPVQPLTEVRTFISDTVKAADETYYSEETAIDNLRLYFMQLQDQLKKALIYTEFSSTEYAKRLQDLISLIGLNHRLREFCKEHKAEQSEVDLTVQLIENVHFMNKETAESIASRKPKEETAYLDILNKSALFDESKALSKRIKSDKTMMRLSLLVSFFLAQSGQFKQAQANLLSCISQQSLINSDEYLQVLANRAMTQLGLCAFARGQYSTAFYYLAELCGSGKLRDLLSQGSRMIEGRLRKKLIPYYMYLPVETIECVQILCSMVLEIPLMLLDETRVQSKSLRKMYEHYEHNYFIASPINAKDLLYSACKELQAGNWRACYQFVSGLLIWQRFPSHESVLALLQQEIKMKALECYLLLHMQNFTSISLEKLGLSFQLKENDVRKVVSQGIMAGNLKGILEGEFLVLTSKASSLSKQMLYLSNLLLDISSQD